jgi:hypothetical protein
MAQAEGKLIGDYLRLDSTKAFLEALSTDMGIPISAVDGLVQVRKGGSDKSGQGLRMTDQIKEYLEQIQRYDDKKYRGIYFSRVHDRINIVVTSETAQEMRDRLSALLGRKVKDNELIRDYFPALTLQRYISVIDYGTR